MRARILPGWIWGVMAAGGLVATCLAQNQPEGSPTTDAPDRSSTAVPAPAAPVEPASPAAKPVPTRVQLSPWALQIQKLAQAQVEEGVMLAYVTNAPGRFDLSADAIIHLKNQGVSRQVMNAMIEHDRQLLSSPRPVLVAAAPGVTVAAPSPALEASPVEASDEGWAGEPLVMEEAYYDAPEPPEGLGPVRAPYPVRLNDPIVILKLPSFTVPYW